MPAAQFPSPTVRLSTGEGGATSVASAVPTDVPSAKRVILAAAQSGAGRLRLTTQAGNAAEVGALALLAGNTGLISAEDIALLVSAGVTGVGTSILNLSAAASAAFAGTTYGEADDDIFTTSIPHGLVAGNRVIWSVQTGSTLPTVGVTYYVIATSLTPLTFKVSASLAGATIDVGAADSTAGTWTKPASNWGEAALAIANS